MCFCLCVTARTFNILQLISVVRYQVFPLAPIISIAHANTTHQPIIKFKYKANVFELKLYSMNRNWVNELFLYTEPQRGKAKDIKYFDAIRQSRYSTQRTPPHYGTAYTRPNPRPMLLKTF